MNRDILGFLYIVLAIVLAILFFSPKVQEVRVVTVNKRAKSELVKAREARVQSLKQIQTVFAQQPDRIKKLAAILPAEAQVPELLVMAESMGKEAGVSLTSIVPQTSTQDKVVFVTLIGEGPLPAIETLSKLLADNGRPMSVNTVSLLRSQDGKSLSFTMVVRAPYNDPDVAISTAQEGEE